MLCKYGLNNVKMTLAPVQNPGEDRSQWVMEEMNSFIPVNVIEMNTLFAEEELKAGSTNEPKSPGIWEEEERLR